jgi:hypothetical protein
VAVDIFTVQKGLDAEEERYPLWKGYLSSPGVFVLHPEGMLSMIGTTDMSTVILGQSSQSQIT